jgi:hypothetical protein
MDVLEWYEIDGVLMAVGAGGLVFTINEENVVSVSSTELTFCKTLDDAKELTQRLQNVLEQ